MSSYDSKKILNLALLGHAGSGKTTLADAILYYAKATDRIGKIDDGTTVMDFDPEEKKRKISVSTSVYSLDYNGRHINLIDAPGMFDFAGGVSEALSAADAAMVVISGKSGLTVGAELAFEKARAAKKAVAFFIGKLNSTHAHFNRVLSALTAHYGAVVCPVLVPVVEGEAVVCYVNLIENKAYATDGLNFKECPYNETDEITNMRSIMLEAVASVNDELMEKYFSGEEFTPAEIKGALLQGIRAGEICPVFGGVQQSGDAVGITANILTEIMPGADEQNLVADGEEIKKEISEGDAPSVYIFKTVADPFVGKLSYFKVMGGKVTADTKLKNARTGEELKLSKLLVLKGGKQSDTSELCAGDIGAAQKLGDVLTGDTLCASGGAVAAPVAFDRPCLSVAVYPQNKGDEEKIALGIAKLAEEDRTISYFTDRETREQILSALGEQHVDVILSKLKAKFGVTAITKAPKVAYREKIRKPVKVQGRYKKQSGGHGQFGDVWIEFEPCDSDEMIFEEKVFGGAVPKNFFPAVEKGLRDSAQKGVLAGYPLVGLKATLVDGSYHPVDSSEMSFKMAASVAYKDGIPNANPVLLEPIGTLKALVPDDNLGDVIGDINKRRGKIIGMNPAQNKMQEVVGEVPIAEMSDFATAMRSITGGRAVFSLEFERYEEAPAHISKKIIEENAQQ